MSPRDRRIVHLALAKFVVTESDGEGGAAYRSSRCGASRADPAPLLASQRSGPLWRSARSRVQVSTRTCGARRNRATACTLGARVDGSGTSLQPKRPRARCC
jgi:hypothetical protein